ncbi:hypothetical protein QAD02_017253 [Eretmocerus hayati]|uniref:Uncharacterized protein n=1 Tax=Eretmocerus hayati TaxID=131215 RepID=A0ACC2PEM2_9HYME|nr:hypothetical protein QAD02_017253 [Eretmocerus hayati]
MMSVMLFFEAVCHLFPNIQHLDILHRTRTPISSAPGQTPKKLPGFNYQELKDLIIEKEPYKSQNASAIPKTALFTNSKQNRTSKEYSMPKCRECHQHTNEHKLFNCPWKGTNRQICYNCGQIVADHRAATCPMLTKQPKNDNRGQNSNRGRGSYSSQRGKKRPHEQKRVDEKRNNAYRGNSRGRGRGGSNRGHPNNLQYYQNHGMSFYQNQPPPLANVAYQNQPPIIANYAYQPQPPPLANLAGNNHGPAPASGELFSSQNYTYSREGNSLYCGIDSFNIDSPMSEKEVNSRSSVLQNSLNERDSAQN